MCLSLNTYICNQEAYSQGDDTRSYHSLHYVFCSVDCHGFGEQERRVEFVRMVLPVSIELVAHLVGKLLDHSPHLLGHATVAL